MFVAAELGAEYSRSQAARMIKAGLVRLNRALARVADVVHAGDVVEVSLPPLQASGAAAPRAPATIDGADSPSPPPINVLFADDEIIVVNKAAGMTVHPAPGHPDDTLVDALLARFPEMVAMAEPGGVMRPGIVHRLDKDTSGVMVVARTPYARMALARQFKERTVSKIYLAAVRGRVASDRFAVSRPVGRHPVERKRMSVQSRHGREAVSEVTVLARMTDTSARTAEDGWTTLVGVRPLTGRTHQIRVHLASIGHPCLGDPLYGRRRGRAVVANTAAAPFIRQALHAMALFVNHPRTGERLRFVAQPPGDFADFVAAHGLECGPRMVDRWIAASARALAQRPVDSDRLLR